MMCLLARMDFTKQNTMIKMNKRQYEKPATRVIALQQRHHLLGMSGEISGYQKSSSGFSQDESDSSNAPQSRGIWDND